MQDFEKLLDTVLRVLEESKLEYNITNFEHALKAVNEHQKKEIDAKTPQDLKHLNKQIDAFIRSLN